MGVWNQKTIIAGQSLSNAAAVKTWIESEMPSGATFAVIMKDDVNKIGWTNNQLVQADWFDSHMLLMIRYRDGNYSNVGAFSYAYDVVVEQNESYTIFYQ